MYEKENKDVTQTTSVSHPQLKLGPSLNNGSDLYLAIFVEKYLVPTVYTIFKKRPCNK